MKELKELDVAGSATQEPLPGFDFLIQWHLTQRCNLRCKHCYQKPFQKDEMSLPEIIGAVDELSDTFEAWAKAYGIEFSPSFNVTGGEPFLRPDLFKILEYIGDRGFETYLLSNGTLIDKEKASLLSRLPGVKGVQISIEGPENIHDLIRGPGSFSAAVEGITNLVDTGLEVTLNATLSSLNGTSVGGLLSIASELRVQRLGFSRLVPCGSGSALQGEMLRPSQVKEIYDFLLSTDIEGLKVSTGDPIASQMKLEADYDRGCILRGGCAAGVSGITILPDGTLTPCRRLDLTVGNIRTDSFREIWSTSEVLMRLRDRSSYRGKCGKCPRWADCRGCRAIAYSYSALKGNPDFLADDPQCFLFTKVK